MRFANPYLLWLLVLLAPIVAFYIYRTLRGGAAIRISSIEGVRRAPRTWRYWLRHAPFVLRCAAVGLMIVALARPQIIEQKSRLLQKSVSSLLVDIEAVLVEVCDNALNRH